MKQVGTLQGPPSGHPSPVRTEITRTEATTHQNKYGSAGSVTRAMFGLLLLVAVFSAAGCGGSGGSTPGVGIQNVSQSAPRLDERTSSGNYQPYFTTGEMQRPRYLHQALFSRTGFVIIMGGSDERGLSALDTTEFFDQSTFDQNAPRPESETGVWFDTNFEGDPIAFETGPRLWFTMTELADGEIIAIGGTSNILMGPVRTKAEIFNTSTRSFESLDEEMVAPRFRHSAIVLNDGSLLITGGQTLTTVTVVEETFFAVTQMQVSVFPSEITNEIFSPTEGLFLTFTAGDNNREVRLNTPRGRSGHAVNRMAGPDGRLSSGDDVFLFAGGYQTLSAQFAPQNKQPGAVGGGNADGLRSLEIFDPQTSVFTQVGNVALQSARIDSPHIMNLGEFNDFTLDGVAGMGNAVLVTHGNSDDLCPNTTFNLTDDLFVASFSGFGPAQGLQLFRVEDLSNGSHTQGVEYASDLSPAGATFVPAPLGSPGGEFVGRSMTNPVAMPRRIESVEGISDVSTWIFAVGGVHAVGTVGCNYFHQSLVMDSGAVFDPYYSLQAGALGNSTRDLAVGRSTSNPLGILGCWLILDGDIPTVGLGNFGTTPTNNWARKPSSGRVYAVNLAVPGEDGITNTPDDRILLSGGGSDGQFQGEEPTNPSAVILIPPFANDRNASP